MFYSFDHNGTNVFKCAKLIMITLLLLLLQLLIIILMMVVIIIIIKRMILASLSGFLGCLRFILIPIFSPLIGFGSLLVIATGLFSPGHGSWWWHVGQKFTHLIIINIELIANSSVDKYSSCKHYRGTSSNKGGWKGCYKTGCLCR